MLSPIQKEIVELPGNLIVRASAGTGKTHTMVSKIEYDIAHCHTHKAVAAITFTIKAAAEIKDRLTIDTSDHFIGTNNSFAIEEIIKPFMKDVFGRAYSHQHIVKLRLGIQVFFFLRHLHNISQSPHGSRYNGNLLYRLRILLQSTD